ncbi:hypothetical protein L798_00560, partial [Zootermopsis nevadensis]
LASAYSNFQIAKQLHRENLQHKPLPDTVDDPLYRALQVNRVQHPGKSLNVGPPRVSAVGYRGYGASGPTGRVSDMHLAICWDLKPLKEEDEPRPSPHIDGSNGSAAPAVFALVHQPPPDHGTKEGCGTKEHCDTKEGCGTPEGCDTPPDKRENVFTVIPKNAWVETKENSSPNVGTRPCVACELKQPSPQYRPRSEYKMAFKAGKPNNSMNSIVNTRPQTTAAKRMHVPKPRVPFAKRSYSIDTLMPPFSLWPGHTEQCYPEHWRLASVYQHAYKPVEARRKPLLASVYQ